MAANAIPSLSMEDDQFRAAITATKFNIQDAKELTEASIVGDAEKKTKIENRIQRRSDLYVSKLTGDYEEEFKRQEKELFSQGLTKQQVYEELFLRGAD